GFGYAFSGEADREAAGQSAKSANIVFKLVWGDREIALQEGENILGRDRAAVAWIDVPSVSRHHARIVVSDGQAILEDLKSKNGTSLQEQRVSPPRRLADANRIRIGSVNLTLRRFVGGASTKSTRTR